MNRTGTNIKPYVHFISNYRMKQYRSTLTTDRSETQNTPNANPPVPEFTKNYPTATVMTRQLQPKKMKKYLAKPAHL